LGFAIAKCSRSRSNRAGVGDGTGLGVLPPGTASVARSIIRPINATLIASASIARTGS